MSNLAYEIQSCIRFVVDHTPIDTNESIKPELLHVIRVGMHLYSHKDTLSREVILAGFMHDLMEEGENVDHLIQEKYGSYIYSLVLANSKDKSISDKEKRLIDINARCASLGFDALIIKAADVYDNIKYVDDMRLPREQQLQRAVFIANNLYTYDGLFNDHSLYLKLKEIVVL